MSREAMKLALEAAYLAGFKASGEGYNGEYPFQDHNAHPAQDEGWCQNRDAYIRETLVEQPAQDDPDLQDKDPELVEQPAQHEPFTHYRHYDNGLQDWADEKTIPLYTFPPAQRTWVGLTEEEVQTAVYDENGCVVDYEDYASAIEAKLREKNQ